MNSYIKYIVKNSTEIKINNILNNPKIFQCNCDYCNKDIFIIFDDFIIKDGYSIYQGIQAKKNNCYKYSPIINKIRNCEIDNIKIENIANSHTRIHTNQLNDLDLRFKDNRCFRRLCNECFLKTYNRVKILDEYSNIEYALSVVNDSKINKYENIDSLLLEFKDIIKYPKILGKGSLNNY